MINPYPIVGNTALGAGIIIKGTNISSQEQIIEEQVITESDYSFIIDPANMGNYNNGDIIRISAGAWYYYISIDTIDYPMGKIISINKPPYITNKRTTGIGTNNGITCGSGKRKR